MRRALPFAVAAGAALAAPLAAQDSTVVREGVRVVLSYAPGSRPGLVLVPGAGLDSVRAIVRRDLDFSDRFDVVLSPDPGGGATGAGSAPFNYELYQKLGASFALELVPRPDGAFARLHDLNGRREAASATVQLPAPEDPGFRMAVHHLSDAVVKWVTGTPGVAATRFAYLEGNRLHVVDSDGAGDRVIATAGTKPLSAAWAPDGRRIAYTAFADGRGAIVLQDLASGARTTVAGTGTALNITPAFSPDGRTLVFARADVDGTNLVSVDAAANCCVRRLTVGRFADNLSPTFAPDGRRLAFVSTRAGAPQVYEMAADGSGAELLVPFDYGATGASNAPDWSPDGTAIAFHRDVSGAPQLFVMDVASRRLRQLTSVGRNEDPSWAPDGRHLAFVSDRSGRRQLWVLDVETSRVRQVGTVGGVRLPAWSRRLATAAVSSTP